MARGGNAIDAAIAVQSMLGLVEPQSSGIGGGAFLLYYDAASGKMSAYNGREKAPASAVPDMLLGRDGTPLPRSEAMLGGRATGVPGVLAMLGQAHADHGRLPWASAFEGTIALARQGYPLTGRTARYIRGPYPQSSADDVREAFRGSGGELLGEGAHYANPVYAETLRLIAENGPSFFYDSDEIAAPLVARTRAAPLPGGMTRQDLLDYRAERDEPLCRPYRVYLVCVPPPPSSGVAVLQILGILEGTDVAALGPNHPQSWFLFAEASKLAYADRDRYVGDPNFVRVPVDEMLDPIYLASRRAMIGEIAMPVPQAGELMLDAPGTDSTREPGGTSHFVIADTEGNVLSMTTTIESYFGSGRTAAGFFLNNQLTDFAFSPVDDDGRPAANAVAGRKRPRSSMSPTIVLDREGKVVAALGSPGGNAIVAYVAKTIVGMIDWKLSPTEAIALPNIVARGDSVRGEASKLPPSVRQSLAARGIDVRPGSGEESGLHAIFASGSGFVGGADPRRDGTVGTFSATSER
nr:gamma-glutamyltransferase family protein [Pelagerythrobacter rhizovicinus]